MEQGKTNQVENNLLKLLSKGDKDAFSVIFKTYYVDLVLFANTYIHDKAVAEEIVQEMFIKLWEKHKTLNITTSLKSYLLKSIQNKCFDWIQHLKVRDSYRNYQLQYPELYKNNTEEYILHSELNKQIEKVFEQLSPEIVKTFKMNRFDGLKYNEIAEELDVSLRTVESRISKALLAFRKIIKNSLLFMCGF